MYTRRDVVGFGGSTPWLADHGATKMSAARNKYLQQKSSIFGDNGEREAIISHRSQRSLQSLQNQVALREEVKRREREEEDRLDEAMAIHNTKTTVNYDPSFADPNASRRRQEGRGPVLVRDTATTVRGKGGRYGGGIFDSGGYSEYGGGVGYDGGAAGGGGYVPSE
ncbi:hypothetical protein Pmani_027610 [Petrolisthes manimaculis]|uniref:Uncharacterized protein n=1 Tax=Petrolisthes manimaculis TaxID=1843537 RepID=A0AAE1TVK9_9EUCA|nr:hypothetical protein Pmani_027610 [Petrolisthes manimaculis]